MDRPESNGADREGAERLLLAFGSESRSGRLGTNKQASGDR